MAQERNIISHVANVSLRFGISLGDGRHANANVAAIAQKINVEIISITFYNIKYCTVFGKRLICKSCISPYNTLATSF